MLSTVFLKWTFLQRPVSLAFRSRGKILSTWCASEPHDRFCSHGFQRCSFILFVRVSQSSWPCLGYTEFFSMSSVKISMQSIDMSVCRSCEATLSVRWIEKGVSMDRIFRKPGCFCGECMRQLALLFSSNFRWIQLCFFGFSLDSSIGRSFCMFVLDVRSCLHGVP